MTMCEYDVIRFGAEPKARLAWNSAYQIWMAFASLPFLCAGLPRMARGRDGNLIMR